MISDHFLLCHFLLVIFLDASASLEPTLRVAHSFCLVWASKITLSRFWKINSLKSKKNLFFSFSIFKSLFFLSLKILIYILFFWRFLFKTLEFSDASLPNFWACFFWRHPLPWPLLDQDQDPWLNFYEWKKLPFSSLE